MANNDKENKIEKFTKEAIGKTLNQFNKEIGMADLVEINKNQDRILNGILSQVNDENTEKTEKSNIITLDNSTDGIVELKEIQGDTNVNVSKIEEMPITHDIGDKEGNVFTLNEITKGAISIGEIQGNTMVNCNKDDKKELVLMKDLSTQGDNNITLTEGVDGGKVDVALEGNTLVNVSKTKDDYITHEREEDTTGNHIALADEGYIRPVLNGKTMVNVCDQKDPIAVTKSYTVENSGNHVALQGEYDGKCRPVITGNTLVNIIQLFDNASDCAFDFSTGSFKHIADGTSKRLYYKVNAKTSTTYTVIANIKKNTVNNNFALVGWRITVGNQQVIVPNGFTGLFVNVITTRESNLSSTWSTDLWKENTEGEIEIDGFMILEGDYSDKPIPDYFTGLQSSFEDNLVTQEMVDAGEEEVSNLGKYRVDYKVVGKNKFDLSNPQIPNGGNVTVSNGSLRCYATIDELSSYNGYNSADIELKLSPNTIYSFKCDSNITVGDIPSACGGIYIFIDGVHTYSILDTTEPRKITTGKTGRVSFKFIGNWTETKHDFDVTFSNIQVEEGDTSTSYEPYKEYTKTLYLNSPLLEGDTIEQYGNNIVHIHRSNKVVLDGGASPWGNKWWESTSNTTDTVFSGGLSSAPYEDIGYCDKLPIVTPSNLSSYDTAITIDGESIIRINIPKELLSRNKDLSAFKTWLNANPITLVGKLKTPQYEVISTNDELITDSYVNGYLDFESAVPVEKVVFNTAYFNNKYLYNNTEYIVQFESDNIGKIYFLALGRNDSEALASKNVVKGINKFKVSTSDKNSNYFYLDGIGFNASNIVVTPAIEQDFGYFSGLSNTFESELITDESNEHYGKYKVEYKVTGKNLLEYPYNNGTKTVNGITFTDNGDGSITVNGTSTGVTNFFIRTTNEWFLPKGTYTFTSSNSQVTAFAGGDAGNIGTNAGKPSTTFTIKENPSKFGKLLLQIDAGKTFDNAILYPQLEEGNTATAYEPYKGYTKTLYLNSPLLEGDTIEEKDDGIYHVHRYEEVVLDDSKHWSINESYTNDNILCIYLPDTKLNRLSKSNVYCNALPTMTHTQTIDSNNVIVKECVRTDSSSALYLYLSKARCNENTFSSYLQQNQLKVVYKLAEPTYELIEQSNLAIPSYSNGHLDLPSAVPVSKVNFLHFEEELTYLYPATSYTIQFISNKAIAIDITLGGTQLLAQNIVKGLNRISITTPETLANNKLIIDGVGAKISEVVVTDTDRKFSYFEGMKSVGEGDGIEILSHNGNLYKRLENSYYKIYGSSVVVVEDNEDSFIFEVNDWDKGISYLISTEGLFKNKKYKLTWEKYNELAVPQLHASGITLLNSNKRVKEQVSFEKISNVDWNFELPDNFEQGDILEIRFKTSIASGQNGACNICINEVGVTKNTALSKLNKQQLTHEPLRAVGEVKDRYVLIDGKWYIERNCKQVNFKDIASSVVIADTTKTNTLRFKWRYTEELNFASTTTGTGFKCDIFKYALYSSDEEGISIKEDIDVNILKSKLTSLDKTGVIQWLNNNPVNLTYIRKTPTYEPIDYNPFEVYSGTTHITTNSAVPTNIAIKNHGFNCLLKPSTTYTVSSNLGLNTVTTGADIGDSCLRFYDEDTSDKTTMKDVLVLEGDWTSKANLVPSNFSGIESCFEQELVTDENDVNYGKYKVTTKVVGKNLININDTKNILIGEALGQHNGTYNDTNYNTIKNIPVTPGKTYSFSNIGWMWTLDKNKKKINNIGILSSYTIPHNCYYLNLTYLAENQNTVQLELGNKVTAYEPYKENNTTFYLNEPLRGVGDSKDRVYVKDDKVVVQRNCSIRPYEDGDFGTYPTDKIDTVYPLAEPTYEEVEYSSNRLILDTFNNESFNNSTLFLDTNISPKLSFKPLWEELVYVKNSTKYYIQFNAVGSGEVVINLGGTELTTEIVEGYNCIPITTPSESTNLMTISGQGITISEVVVSEVICGGYYKGLQSCFEEHMENGKHRVLLRGIALDESKVNGIKLYINEPLRGIDGVKDRLCIKNGKLMVEKNYSSVILDGTGDVNDVTSWGASSDKTIEFRLGYNQFENKKGDILCDNFISETSNLWTMDTEGIQSYTANTVDIRINKTKLFTQDKTGFIQWLQQNPTTVVYQLKEPIYEEATNEYGLPIVFEGYENGIVYIDSAVTPTTHIKYTSNNQLATTLSEAEEQNVATQEDINMNVVTYMMDIDMILTEMEMSNDTSVMAVRRDSSNENMLDRMSKEDKKVYQDNTVVMLEKMITANVLEKEDIEGRINMYYNKNRISKEQYEYLKSLL